MNRESFLLVAGLVVAVVGLLAPALHRASGMLLFLGGLAVGIAIARASWGPWGKKPTKG